MKCTVVVALALLPASAIAQRVGAPQSLPLVVDLRKAPVGCWAEYRMHLGNVPMKSRWALVARDGKSVTLEMTMEGAMSAQAGGPIAVRMVLDPDPIGAAKPVREMVMQMGNRDPIMAPPNTPTHKFRKPDAKTLVGTEDVKVAAGTFKTKHYREDTPAGVVDVWVSEKIPPLGLVKIVTTPDPKSGAANQRAVPVPKLELMAIGTGAKPIITKPAKVFDAKKTTGSAPPPTPQIDR